MWLFLGITASITAVLGIVQTIRRRSAKWFRYISLSLTALTLCAGNRLVSAWVLQEDWSALADAVPGMAQALCFFTITSVLLNGISLFQKTNP